MFSAHHALSRRVRLCLYRCFSFKDFSHLYCFVNSYLGAIDIFHMFDPG